MKHQFIETENYIKCYEALDEMVSLPDHSHKMGLFYGEFGLGKTITLERLANETGAALVRTLGGWTPKSMLSDICYELGVDDSGSTATLETRVINTLIAEPRPIIIDEIDTILSGHKNEMVVLRDIHDKAAVPIVFTGMEQCLRLLRRDRHYFSRFVNIVKITPNTRNDIAKYCQSAEIAIEEDLVDYLHTKYANLRQIKTIIIRLERFCEDNDLESANVQVLKTSKVEERNEI